MSSIYQNKRVLVTGDTGFKGSWLSLFLKFLGAEVTGYALPPEHQNDHYVALQLSDHINHVDGDIRDIDKLKLTIDSCQPEFIFHLAAQSLVGRSYKEPKQTFDTNIAGSVNVLEVARSCESLKVLIYVTSDKCYSNKGWVWGYRENDELGGRDPYSASKAAAEIVFWSYLDSFFNSGSNLGAASVRAGNVIGGGDWSEDRLIPDSMRAVLSNRALELRNPAATRPWQHVLEPLFAYLLLGAFLYKEPARYSGSWNFGPQSGSSRSVWEVASAFMKQWGRPDMIVADGERKYREETVLHLNSEKAFYMLDWEQAWDFDRTLRETADWYRRYDSGESAYEISTEQIKNYLKSQQDRGCRID